MTKHHADIVIAGGGTGGHFFCGVAIAELYLEMHPQSAALFVGAKQGIEGRTQLPDPRMRIEFVAAGGFKNLNWIKRIMGLGKLAVAIFQSFALLLRARPRLVVGVGGYASFACVLIAVFLKPFLRFRVFVVEQNSSPGLVNRIFARLGVEAYSAFPSPGFREIDLPVRARLRSFDRSKITRHWPPKTIFILGGSQGAQAVNQAWIKVLKSVQEKIGPELRVIHQTGRAQEQYIRAIYEDHKINAEVFAFSDDLSRYYAESDLVIARAGALSIFEIIQFECPAIFVPFPYAADDHQFKNAEAVQDRDWILSEAELTWKEIKPLLEAKEPKIPRPPSAHRGSWGSLLR